MPDAGDSSQRTLVFAPLGRDGELLAKAAIDRGLLATKVTTVDEFAHAFREGCAAALLTEEALYEDRLGRLRAAVEDQPAWSEVPFVILTSRGQAEERVRLTVDLMTPLRNVTVLERPVRPRTIVTALEAALRDRRRQYEVRDAIEALRLANLDLERRVETRTVDLVEKVSELERFCYSVSHDMRTPLRGIIGNAAMIIDDEGERLSEEGRRRLNRMSEASIKMARLVDDLLKYARLGIDQPRREPCDFTEIALHVAAEALGDGRKLPVDIEIEPGLTAYADPRLLGLVLQNLIDNAIKYRLTERPTSIQIGQTDDGTFFVRDNGIGFDMKYVHKLFEPFERLHRDSEYPGTGIGLANVTRIVEQHGGRVRAESEGPGTGATFSFTLPPACEPPEPSERPLGRQGPS